jgi:hypothetical protein
VAGGLKSVTLQTVEADPFYRDYATNVVDEAQQRQLTSAVWGQALCARGRSVINAARLIAFSSMPRVSYSSREASRLTFGRDRTEIQSGNFSARAPARGGNRSQTARRWAASWFRY